MGNRGRGRSGVLLRGRGGRRGGCRRKAGQRGWRQVQKSSNGNARLRLKRVHKAAAKLEAAVERCESLVATEEEVSARLMAEQERDSVQQQQQQTWLQRVCTRALLTLEAAVNCLQTAASKVLVGRVQDPLHAHSKTILMLPTAGLHGIDVQTLLQHTRRLLLEAGHIYAAELNIPSLPCFPPTLAILTCDGGGSQAHKNGPQEHPTTLQQVGQLATAEAAERLRACRNEAGMPQAGKCTQQQTQRLKQELAAEILTLKPQRLPAAFSPMPGKVPPPPRSTWCPLPSSSNNSSH